MFLKLVYMLHKEVDGVDLVEGCVFCALSGVWHLEELNKCF